MFCKDCGTEIENGAKFCPNCGKPIDLTRAPHNEKKADAISHPDSKVSTEHSTSSTKKTSKIRTFFYGIFCIIAIFAFIKSCNPDNNILGIDGMRDAYSIAQDIIKENISTPNSAKFPKFEPEFVSQKTETIEYQGEEYIVRTVSAYFDHDNIFGVSVRSNYIILVGHSTADSSKIYYEIIDFD